MNRRTDLFDMAREEMRHRAEQEGVAPVGKSLEETGRQSYTDTAFSAGLVRGHEHDTIYLKLERAADPLTLLLRRDEALAVIWLLGGALWSEEVIEDG